MPADAATDPLRQQLKARHDARIAERARHVEALAASTPDHPFVRANPHLLERSSGKSWGGSGMVSMAGVVWWALHMSIDVLPVAVVSFEASGGPDLDIAVFSSAVTGYFFVDPSTLGGKARFTLEAVAGGGGEIDVNLYDTSWKQLGSFAGVVVGVSVSKISGEGTLTYHDG